MATAMASPSATKSTISFTPDTPPRISFSSDLSNDHDFININPILNLSSSKQDKKVNDFEFSSQNVTMITADELFSQGKLLPFRQIKHSENLKTLQENTRFASIFSVGKNVTLKTKDKEESKDLVIKEKIISNKDEEVKGSWFIDDDPSPRPPNCTVLWKELLRLKKQRMVSAAATTRVVSLSPSSSSSSTSSCSSLIGDVVKKEEGKRSKKGLERTRSVSMRIRPMIHVPVCTHNSVKSSASLPPLFPLGFRKNREEKRV